MRDRMREQYQKRMADLLFSSKEQMGQYMVFFLILETNVDARGKHYLLSNCDVQPHLQTGNFCRADVSLTKECEGEIRSSD